MVKALGDVDGLEDLTSDLAGDQPAGQRRDRPRQGGGARRHRERHRERVLRRVRPALGVDDLRAGQRIQGPARAGAAIPGGPGGALAALLQGEPAPGGTRRRRQRRQRPRVPARAGGAGGGGTGSRRPARHAGARDAGHRPADGEPLRPAAGGHDLLRPRAGRVARRRAEPRARGRRGEPARRRQRPVPGRGQGVPELARRTSRCCSSSRSWSSTSCSASCTRATSTR